MVPLLTAGEMRAADDHAIRVDGVPGQVLMENAGREVFRRLWEDYGVGAQTVRTVVVCGKGNNGGDGFVVARCLAGRGCPVSAVLLGNREAVRGDAAVHLGAYLATGGELLEAGEAGGSDPRSLVAGAGLIVDAVLGTGLTDEVRGAARDAIEWINGSPAPVVSVDLPSGVSSDTGRICGAAVRADLTVTFAYPKRGHYLYPGAALAGRLVVADIGIPPSALRDIETSLYLLEREDFSGLLSRPADSHKGTFGHVVVFGGSAGKEGAAGLAGWAALVSGAGLSTVAWPAGIHGAAAARLPLEVMTEPLPEPGSSEGAWCEALWDGARDAQGRADALVVGPGMGGGDGVLSFLRRLFDAEGPPLVIDADALNALARCPDLWTKGRREAVLTPHPGEAGRLLGVSSREVQGDRLAAVRELSRRFGATVVLKGAHTLICAGESPVHLVAKGNPGMATAGAGDVLSGVLGALLARGIPPPEAARLGAYLHAIAGDLAADEVGEDGLTASGILRAVPRAVRTLALPSH